MKHEESELQRNCIKWFDYAYPKLRMNLFAIPNGGRRGKIEASIMKGEGVRAGVADLFLAVPLRSKDKIAFHGLFIELKSAKGVQSKSQILFHQVVINEGYRYVICKSFDVFKAEIDAYLTFNK